MWKISYFRLPAFIAPVSTLMIKPLVYGASCNCDSTSKVGKVGKAPRTSAPFTQLELVIPYLK